MEIQHIPAAIAFHNNIQYAKVADIQFPANGTNTTVTLQNVRSYHKGALWNDVNSWFNGGPTPSGTFNNQAAYEHLTNFGWNPILHSSVSIGLITINEHSRPKINMQSLVRGIDSHPHTFRYEWFSDLVRREGNYYILPNYYRLDSTGGSEPTWTAIPESAVPSSTGLVEHEFEADPPPNTSPRETPHTTNPDWANPGPAAGPFTIVLGDNTRVTYYWYRFIDQPAVTNAGYSSSQRQKLQQKIELIHRHWPINRNYMAPPEFGNLASIDPGSIVSPPAGLEIGYVPIVTHQELNPNINFIPGTDLTQPGDPIINSSSNRFREDQGAESAIDDDNTTFFLSNDTQSVSNPAPSGFIVSPTIGATIVDSFVITSSDHAPERDPRGIQLHGSNDNDPQWNKGNWALLYQNLSLPNWSSLFGNDHRNKDQKFTFSNIKPFKHYRLTITSVVGPNSSSSQIGELQLLGIPVDAIPPDYQNWSASFNFNLLTNPDADYDQDSLTNRYEWLFGLNPMTGNSANNLVRPTSTPNQFTYRRRSSSLSGYSYTIWLSETMETDDWFTDASTTQTIIQTHNDGTETVLVSIDPNYTNEKVFFRIKAN